MHDLRLRPGAQDDMDFILRVHKASMRPHVERVYGPWDDALQREQMKSTDPTTHDIVELEGEPVGCQWIREHPAELELVRLYLLPEAQGRGVGSQLLANLCARADAEGRPVRLRVLRGSPARRFYERHGFTVVDEIETHFQMARPPES
jgi:GNAT superfamily N-acetyltransferase